MITLLGPQHAQPTVARVLAGLKVRGAVAAITAGWQEREADASVLPELGVRSVNLELHVRGDAVFAADREYATAYKARQTRLRLMQEIYRGRLARLDEAARAIAKRHIDDDLLTDERAASRALVAALDLDHVTRCRATHAAFDAKWPSTSREVIVAQRRQLADAIASCEAVVITGGHVAVLLNRLQLFGLPSLWGDRPIIAWSAGAMALCELVVLFHDAPPQGGRFAEVLDVGLGLVKGIVALPNPRIRLHLDDREHVASFARRFGDLTCVAMDHGARIDVEHGRAVGGAGNQRLRDDGTIARRWP